MQNKIKTVVFDLDGTIYQNNSFHRDYVHFLLDGTDKIAWEKDISACIDRIYKGELITMNAYYDGSPIDAQNPVDFFEKLGARRMDGMSFEEALGDESIIYTGDAWALVSLIGSALGLLEGERSNEVYKRTRNKMSRDGMNGSRRLHDAIIELGRHYNTVLLTNSYESTAQDFLHQLQFDDVFNDAVYSANKPWGMAENLARHRPELYTEPQSFLTVGDHAFNDLMPLQKLGCKALWINPFEGINEPAYDITVHTLDELACCLEGMC